MWKIKLILIVSILILGSFYFNRIEHSSKEIELLNEDLGNFYKEYIITKQKKGIRLKNYFTGKEIYLKEEGIKSIVNLNEDYQLLQLDNVIYLKSNNKLKIQNGNIGTKIGENYLFKENGRFGLLDKDLNILIQPIYNRLLAGEKSSLLLAEKDGKFGYLNFKGETIIPFEYDVGTIEENNLMIVKKNNGVGVINKKNEQIIEFIYDEIYSNQGSQFIVLKNKEYFLIDKLGKKERINASWMGIQKTEKIFYEKDGKFGIFDFQTGYVTGNIYEQLSQNYSELIIAMKNGKYGLINNKNTIILPFSYDYILPVGENYFKVGSDITGLFFLINQKGEIKTSQIFDDFIELNKENIVGIKENKLILLNEKGKEIKEIESLIKFNTQMLLYKKAGKNILRKL